MDPTGVGHFGKRNLGKAAEATILSCFFQLGGPDLPPSRAAFSYRPAPDGGRPTFAALAAAGGTAAGAGGAGQWGRLGGHVAVWRAICHRRPARRRAWGAVGELRSQLDWPEWPWVLREFTVNAVNETCQRRPTS